MEAYYDARAEEYDDWYEGTGRFEHRDRPGWAAEVRQLTDVLERLPAAATLDVACGTGYLTRHLRGAITGIDQSRRMLAVARERVPAGTFVLGDALALPFGDGRFERLFTSHFYGHLDPTARGFFLAEASRVADELVIVDAARRPDHEPQEHQERVLNDGSRWKVFKRYFTAAQLMSELGGVELLHDGAWFVAVRKPR